MRIYILLFTFAVTALLYRVPAFAQTDRFDIASFTVPAGWKKDSKANVVTFTQTGASGGGYCVIAVYKSITVSDSPDKAFASEWKELVADRFTVTSTVETDKQKRTDGWQAVAGVAGIQDGNGAAIAILHVLTRGNQLMSVLSLTNKEEYIDPVEKFISTMRFSAPAQTSTTAPAGGQGFRFSSTRFDDGWNSSVQKDYVLVEKGLYSVYLCYTVPYQASRFSGTGVRDVEYYWDNYVSLYFQTKTKQYNDGGSMALKPPYMEGTAIDKRTGKPCFIGLYLLIVPNATTLVIGTAPDESRFRTLFPKANDPLASDLAGMERYNKFAVGATDLSGQWQNGNTSTAHWFYTTPSGYESYAGMTLASTSAVFQFHSNGSYASTHNGATGSVGNMGTFQQSYKGSFSITDWTLKLSGRRQGRTDSFNAYFKAVRGGRILMLDNQQGEKYSLVRTK